MHAAVNRAKETTTKDVLAPSKKTVSTVNDWGQPAKNGTDASLSLSQLRMNMEETVETLGQMNDE
jgi:hypothetical protein